MASQSRLVLDGLAELRQQLRQLPEHLRAEGSEIVVKHAERAKAQAASTYQAHARSGNLARGLTIAHDHSQFGHVAIVQNRAKHAWMYENGTQARHTAIGANRGAMPPAHAFLPVMIRERRAMVQDLMALVQRDGLVVRGAA